MVMVPVTVTMPVSIQRRRGNEIAIRTNETTAHFVRRSVLHCTSLTGTGPDHARLAHRTRLVAERLPTAPAHETISAEVGHLKGRHLPGDLPGLRDGED